MRYVFELTHRAYRKTLCCNGWQGLICLSDRMLFGLSPRVHEAHRRCASRSFIQNTYWRAN